MVIMLLPAFVAAQTYFDVDFSDDVPPDGWTIDSHSSNWSQENSNLAGGTAPEAMMNWSPQFSGYSRLISPVIDLTGVTNLSAQFKHSVDNYAGGYTLGVATRNGSNSWNIVYSVSPDESIEGTTIDIVIDNEDVGTSDFQICWYFSGSSYNINYWYLDDLKLYTPLDHDFKPGNILVEDNYDITEPMVPSAEIVNFGINDEVGGANCVIAINGTTVYNQTVSGISISAGETAEVDFPSFTLPTANEMYDITVTSILDGDMDNSNDTATAVFNTYTTPRDMVVVEIATGTWCGYCPGAAMGAEDLVDNDYNVAVIENHGPISSDDFANEYSVARNNYYNISGYPTAFFDGILSFVGGSGSQSMYEYYVPLVEERQPINCAFSIAINGTNTDDDYSLIVTVEQVARNNYENMVLQVALTESDIDYSWQGQDVLMWVNRTMTPDADGTELDFSSGDVQEIELSFTMDADWVEENCELVAFIQTNDTKEVLQGTKIELLALAPVSIDDEAEALPMETSLKGNYPNPFNPSTVVEFSLREASDVTLDVFNIMGQKVATLVDSHMEAGNHSVVWNSKDKSGNSVASGAYFYKLTAGDYTSVKKMLLVK